ncbi:MAG: B12-binding domain-containing protein [Fimbriimonadaceae bacterium]|nr:B12-binding domain-containing protein [Fimbriimonadaceae bacterium]
MSEDRKETRGEITYDPLVAFMALFENVRATDDSVDAFEGLGVEDRLKRHIVQGIKKRLETHLASAMEQYSPLHIINEILLDGMKTVGELFGAGKMQLPFVLQSAEVMKAAVAYLEPHMDRVEGQEKGSILLATVAGDVHDIGKNLVDIILTNNGYRVVNIGIKQPINTILESAEKENCDVIGLSGLLVKSTLVMRDNLVEMNRRGVSSIPVILGGAALTRSYVEEDLREIYDGRVFYAKDAFEGLSLMETIASSGASVPPSPEPLAGATAASHRRPERDEALYVFTGERSDTPPTTTIPTLPFYGAKKRTQFDIFELYRYINPIALFRGQWQYKKPEEMTNPEFTLWLEEHVRPIFEQKQRELAGVMKPAVKWGYFWAQSERNDLIIYHEDQRTERARFTFPRQRDGQRLCLSDFFRSVDSGEMDVAGFHIVTVGGEVSEYERSLFARGDYQDYLYVHGMGVETAEALAEYWHQIIRREMGIDDEEPDEFRLLFSARYHGSRYSFGYPACPNLEDQAILMDLLEPADIGITLSEEFMLEPEQSTSAIIVHHPSAKYFNIR